MREREEDYIAMPRPSFYESFSVLTSYGPLGLPLMSYRRLFGEVWDGVDLHDMRDWDSE